MLDLVLFASVVICFLLVSLLLGNLLSYDLFKEWFRNKKERIVYPKSVICSHPKRAYILINILTVLIGTYQTHSNRSLKAII